MSIVCAVRKEGQVAIAGDTLISSGTTRIHAGYLGNPSKILAVDGSYIGVVGWSAVAIAFEHLIASHPEKLDFSSRMAIFRTLLEVQKMLKENYYIKTDEDQRGQPVESNQLDALLINEKGMYKIGSFREVDELTRFWATGSGRSFALGAMFAAFDQELTALQIAELGAQAAIEFNDSCGGPLVSYALALSDA